MVPEGLHFHTFWLNAYSRVSDLLLVLQVEPRHLHHERNSYTHEIHITSSYLDKTSLFGSYGFPRYIKDLVPIFICEEIEFKGKLSFFEGENEYDSEISFQLPYDKLEYKKFEKNPIVDAPNVELFWV